MRFGPGRLSLLWLIGFCSIAEAQTGISVAGFGYRKPGNAITAAPGQVMIVSVFGITARIPEPVFPVAVNGLPTEVAGISAEFVQGPVSVQLEIRGVQQSPCPASGPCSPSTSLTIQIPYELNPDSASPALLRISEHSVAAADVALNGVTDSVHVINTCDQTGIYLSLAAEVPAGSCVPMVMHARGPRVSSSAPAVPGEELVVWVYGLGAVEHPIPEPCCASPDQLPLAVQPVNVNLSYADAGRFPLKRLARVVPDYAGMVGSGIYQVQFAVPAVPADMSPCSYKTGNLFIEVSGPNSADTAQVCVQP